jgi:hypothetical protein
VTRRSVAGRAGALVAVGLAAAVLTGASACAPSPRQTTVIPTEEQPGSGGPTALERGRLRREVLAATDAGMAAWRADDIEAMKKYFSEKQVAFYEKLKARNRAAGRLRVRRHLGVSADVTELSSDGRQASVQYEFTNASYFTDLSGRRLTGPANSETEIDLTLVKNAGGWTISTMIAGREALE